MLISPSGGGDDRSMCVAMAGILSLRKRFEEEGNTSYTHNITSCYDKNMYYSPLRHGVMLLPAIE